MKASLSTAKGDLENLSLEDVSLDKELDKAIYMPYVFFWESFVACGAILLSFVHLEGASPTKSDS